MKKYLFAAAAAIAFAPAANAAAVLTSAAVTGPSGTVWDTSSATGFYALFLQQPVGNLLNPTDNFSGDPTAEGANNFVILGEGFRPGETENSDPLYNLTLTFADGAVITGQYVFGTGQNSGGMFQNGTSATQGNTTYTLTGFGWDRARADNVSAYSAVSGGDPNDYTGQFSFTATTLAGAVPEPATWAMFILGFGVMGGAMRRRANQGMQSRAVLRMS